MGSIKQNLANNILSGGKFDATDLDGTIPNTNINDNSIDNVTSFPAAGSGIPSVASDPPSPSAGDVWYNTTSNAFKYVGVTTTGSWATGGGLNNGRYAGIGGAGTQTAGLAFGGYSDPLGRTGVTEAYDGSAWTELNDLNTGRSGGGSTGQSPQSTAFYYGGDAGPVTVGNAETWNGTSWTEVADLNTSRENLAGAGVQTLALAFGGRTPPNNPTGVTESWNGSSWTEVNDLNTARAYLHGSGTQTAAIGAGGYSPTAVTELWNGTSWTEVNDLNTGRGYLPDNGGTQTNTIVAGGYVSGGPYVGNTETWNGTSWTEDADLSGARGWGGNAGTSSALIYFGGTPPTATTATEEWTGAGSPVTKTVTTA